MRVLELVTTSGWGGAQAQVQVIVRELLSRGHEVHVAAGGSGELLERASQDGAKVYPLRWLRGPVSSPHSELLAYREISSLLRLVSPEVLHTHSSKAGVLGRVVAAAAAGASMRRQGSAPVVVHTCHGLAWGPGRRRGAQAAGFFAAERLSGRLCDGVICISADVHRLVVAQRLYPRARHVVIPNGIALGDPGPGPFTAASAAARDALLLPPLKPLVVLAARLVEGKGHLVALDAAARLAKAGRSVSLVFAGDGPLRVRLEEEAARPRAAGADVIMLGHRRDIASILRAADIVVVPSSAEGLSLTAIEGMAAGVPVVGSRIRGLDEVIVDGRTGLFFDLSEGAPALCASLERLLDDPQLSRELGRAGRVRAETKFSLHNTALSVDFLEDIARCSDIGQARAREARVG